MLSEGRENLKIPDRKTRILVFMSLSLFLAYLPWYNFSALLKSISAEFHLTAADSGMILSAYQAGYVVIVLLSGWLADKVGSKKVVIYATLFTGVFSTSFAWLAIDKWTILILRLTIGCASGAIYAPGMALLSNWFPPERRGHALGAYTGGLVAAYAGSYFIASPIATSYGWRTGMLTTSLPVFMGCLILWFFVKEKPTDSLGLNEIKQIQSHSSKLDYKGPALITLAYMGHMWELYAFWGWIGPFMVASVSSAGIPSNDAAALGNQLAAFIVLVGVPAVWLLGLAADKIGRIKAIMIASIASLIPQLFFGHLIGQPLSSLMTLGVWIGFWIVADSAIYKASLTEMTPAHLRATLLGVQSALGFGMTIISPTVFGQILDYYNNGVAPTEAVNWWPSFFILGIGALLSPIATLILAKTQNVRKQTSQRCTP